MPVMKTETYDIKTAVWGEMRQSGEVITYDLKAGRVEASDVHPLVLARLIQDGIAVATVEKKEPKA